MRHLGSYPYDMSAFIEESCTFGHRQRPLYCGVLRHWSPHKGHLPLAGFQARILVLIPLVLETSYYVLYA